MVEWGFEPRQLGYSDVDAFNHHDLLLLSVHISVFTQNLTQHLTQNLVFVQ